MPPVKYEYLFATWEGRLKLVAIVLGVAAISCCAPAHLLTQHWFLLVASVCLIGTVFFALYHVCLDGLLEDTGVDWPQMEFRFTALAALLYFPAFVSQLFQFGGVHAQPSFRVFVFWQIVAGVFGLFNDVVYGVAVYLLYLDSKASPVMTPPAA
jgi:hypothetical protein